MSVIDEYLESVEAVWRAELEHVREIVMGVVPDGEDNIGYGMPVIKYKGKYLIGFAPFKDHLSIFPGAGPIVAFKNKLIGYKISKGTVQFTPEHRIPDDLLRKLILHRKNDIDKK